VAWNLIIRGVALGTLEEQRSGGDVDAVDPTVIKLPDGGVPVRENFDPTRPLGHTTKLWLEDGRILFEARVQVTPGFWIPCAGFRIGRASSDKGVESAILHEISFCESNANKDQPPATLIK
jgi:hypothetical protein